MEKEAIATVWIDPHENTVEVEFTERFLARDLDEQAAIATALLEAALSEHVEAQDARASASLPA